MRGRVLSLLTAVLWASVTMSGEQVSVDNAPRIITNNGNLMFQTGNLKEIHFETPGRGNIKFNDIEIHELYGQMKEIKTYISQNSNRNNQCDCSAMKLTIASNTQKIQNLRKKLKRTVEQVNAISTMVNNLRQISTIDECTNSPCHNGGICVDGFGKYKCMCKEQYKGPNCMEDVNECTQLTGTDLGCQNNARCENFVGGFRCICTGKWAGVLCNTPQNGCAGLSNVELCGHGLCLPDHSVNNPRSYKCICDHGWSLDLLTNTCINDVNECSVGRYPCSEVPKVQCINTAGSFTCDQCPQGYSGNGFSCFDVNECLNANICGINQQCTNTIGSYKCQCVEGMTYNENGVCRRQNICLMDNGGCNMNARCTSNPDNIEGRTCICNYGYVGNGVGINGCIQSQATNETNFQYRRCIRRQLCRNGGTCQLTATGFTCQCAPSFTGARCRTQIVNRCQQNPCQNGGTCATLENNNYLCTCTAYFTGQNCEIEHSECGGSIISPRNSKQINFLTTPSLSSQLYRYPCIWTVLVAEEQFIQIKPVAITHQWIAPCSVEYIQIVEKSSSEGETRQLAKICRETPVVQQNGYNTTGPILLIKAHFQNNIPDQRGFSIGITPISYTAQNLDCCRCVNGQHVITEATEGIFYSPHYPLNYPAEIDCLMQFERPFGQRYRVVLSIVTLDLGDSNGNCSDTDNIKIYYVERGETKLSACNQGSYQNLKFITSGFKLQFHSDSTNNQSPSRFRFSWRKTSNEDPCGGILFFQNTAVIEAPSLAESQEAYCTWNIHQSNRSQMISLKGVFNNWVNGDCSVYIKILTVYLNGLTTLLFEQCQSSVMLDSFLEEITGKLIIIFKKPLGISTPGFRIQATYICGKVIDMDQLTSYELLSPNYPRNYDNDLNCVYRFVARTRSFSVNFIDFDVTDEDTCQSDYIEVQGATKSFSNGRFCSGNMDSLIPIDKEMSQSPLVINFGTNSSVTGRGFKAIVTLLECGGSYYLSSRLLIAYPDDHLNSSVSVVQYGHSKNCVWNIISQPGSYIFAIFDHFHLEYHQYCQYDYLAVTYDNVTDRKYCGNIVQNIVTKSNKLKLVFNSDYSVTGEGFILRLYLGSMETHCHQEFTAAEGQIQSPTIGSMPRPYFCTYSITVPEGRKVAINITIEGATDRNYSSYILNRCFAKGRLRIKNGNIGAATMRDICPESPQTDPIQTSSNKALIIYFVPAYRTTYEFNFTISFHSIDEECGSIHRDEYGEIASPNYPLFAPKNSYCQWEIQSIPGRQIVIRIIHIRAGSQYNTLECNDNRHPVIKLVSVSKEESISCDQHTESLYKFEDNILRIIFKNYENTQYRFRLSYKLDCVFITNSPIGRIEKSNIISGYPFYCLWTINILRGSMLHLQFHQFDLPPRTDGICRAYLTITDSQNTLLAQTCGNTLINNTFQSSESPVTIRHYVRRDIPFNVLQAHRGFTLEYNTVGCIFNINYDPSDSSNYYRNQRKTGSISSPDYPNSVIGRDCIWTFKTVIGYSVKLTFDVVELDSFLNCSEGHILKARDGENSNDNYTFFACDRASQNKPIIFQSSTRYLYLKFQSANDVNGGQRKFHATYEFINSSCEYQLTAPDGFINSPNYPAVYPKNVNCKWALSVRQGMSIHLKFLDFDIEGSSCRYDYVQLFSQLNDETMPMTRLCGNQLNLSQIYQSFDNQMLVTFKTDYSVQRKGFKARFFEGCGGQRNATERNQFLVSPNYPHQYNLPDSICEWTISANVSNPGERIFFYFFGFESDSSDLNRNCTPDSNTVPDHSLAIIDGLEDTPIKTILCSDHPSPPIISNGHFLRVILKSTSGKSIFRGGFGIGSSACGGNYFLDDGILTSPFYPNAVNMHMDCIYVINNSPGSEVDLRIEEFTRSNENVYVYHDFLEVRIGSSLDASTLIGRYYSLTEMQNATTNVRFNDSVVIRFRSQGGSYTNSIKFLAKYHINYQTDFQNDQGSLASPQFGHLYKSDTYKSWTISPITTQAIEIEFLNFSVGRQLQNGDCDRGKLIIEDGNRNVKLLCGPNLPSTEKYQVPVLITLVAEGYRYDGFLLKWSPRKNESFISVGLCKYVITATKFSQIFTSPNFPDFDPINRDCEWTIVAPKGGALELKILNFTMENSRNCKYENFTISMKEEELYYPGLSRRYRWFRRHYFTETYCGTQNTSLLDFTKNLIFSRVKINFKVDEFDRFPGFKLQYKLRCYQEINEQQGWLQNEEYPNYMTEFKNCTYRLQLKGNREYKINVTAINLPPATDGKCKDGYLEIYTTQHIGKYCGPNVPRSLQPLLTNSSTVYIRLVGAFDQFQSFSGFQLKYTLVEVEECGGNFMLSRDNDVVLISNPGGDSVAPHYIECKWLIASPYGTRMKIDFVDLQIHISSLLCDESFIALYDGSTMLSRKIGDKNYCENQNSVFTSDNRLFILFKNLDAYSHFKIRISIGLCGGNLYKPDGVIVSPNYPNSYPLQTKCIWTIKSSRPRSFTILFDEIYLNSDCSKANLTIYSVDNPSRFNWSSCVDQPLTIQVMSSVVEIIFNTNSLTRSRGFKLSYQSREIECGSRLTDPNGEAMSMGYPQTLPSFTLCEWQIESDVSKRVTIKILNLTLRRRCLRIYNELHAQIVRICNRDLENFEIDTNSSKATLQLYSDGYSRISFSYHTDQPSFCGSHIYPGTNDTGLITFEANTTISYCRHIVHNYPGDIGTVAFKILSSAGLNCLRNRIVFTSTVYEAIGMDSVIDSLNFCTVSDRYGVIYTSMGKTIDITYFSNPYSAAHNQTIAIAYKYQRCGGIITDSFGYISSPNYPNKYPHLSNCEWIIKTGRNMHIKLIIVTLNLERHSTCKYDYLHVRSGPEFDSPPMKTFCGKHNITNETVIFRNNQLRLSFKSDASASADGFLIQYNAINAIDNCNGFIFNNSGVIQSPNYPNFYPDNTRCNWTLIVPIGYRIELTFQKTPFDLENATAGGCPYDSLQIIDSNPESVLRRLCGHIAPTKPILSSENRMGLIFTSDYNLHLDGFRAFYRSVCGGTFNNTYGEINSPNVYILTSNTITSCQYVVPSWKNYLTVLSISASLQQCRYSYGYVEIWKEVVPGRYVFGQRICGKSYSPIVIFNTLSIMIRYNTTFYYPKTYFFKVNYLHDETVKIISNFTGQRNIRTPQFPSPYHHNADLQWKFQAPSNYIFYIEILNVDIEYSVLGCIYDYVAFYSGDTTNSSSLVSRFCGLHQNLIPFRIDSNNITIHFVSDSSHYANHTGFTAIVISTPGPQLGCGGEIILTPTSVGSIASVDLDNDGKYDNRLMCHWRLYAPNGYVIQLRFENNSVELERQTRQECRYDWLKIFDGQHPTSPIINNLCGNVSVDPFLSTGSTILVMFHTDSSITHRGFRIHYSVIRSINNVYLNATSDYQIVTSPGYPDTTTNNFKSLIEILAPSESDHILIELKELSIRPTINCSLDSFQIMDTSLKYVNQLRKFCKAIELPVPFISSDNKVVAIYKIGPQEALNYNIEIKYKMEYKIYSCNRTETAYSGRIFNVESLKRKSYSHNTICNLTLEAPSPDLHYQFYFKKLILEQSATCAYDYIQFTFGRPSEQQYSLPRICGQNLPPSIISNSSFVTMMFVSDGSVTLEGFDITYVVNRDPQQNCGGDINLDSGAVTSLGFGRNVYEIGDCTWNIATASMKSMSWKITDLQFDSNVTFGQSCYTATDYIQITYNNVVRKFCGNTPTTREFQVPTGQIIVKYRSTTGGTGIGFRLEWKTVVTRNSFVISPLIT